MKSRVGKLNIYIVLFSILMILAVVVIAFGSTWSRYQTNTVVEIPFEVKKPGVFKLTGLEVSEEGTVTEVDTMLWKPEENGNYQMNFRVANAKEEEV